MKLRYLLLSVLACAAVAFTSCESEVEISSLGEFKASPSYIGFDLGGGSVTSEVTATDTWSFDTASIPEWLTVSPTSGSAGTSKITFTAASNSEPAARNVELYVTVGDNSQIFTVTQEGAGEAPVSTIKEVLAGSDGATYKVSGTVTGIANTEYGNFYIEDEEGNSLYVYGVKDASGNYPKDGKGWESFGIEVGDIVTVQGPRKTYSGTVELVDASVVSVVKSLLSVEPKEFSVEKEGGVVTIKVTYKGNDLKVEPQEDWLSLAGVSVASDTTVVSIKVAANEEDTRVGTVVLSSSIPSQTSEAVVTITQATGLSVYPLPYEDTFTAGQGAWEIKDITPRPDGKAIWATGNYNGTYYMVAKGGSKVDTKSMLISPKISLKNAASPVLTFRHAGKYCGDQAEELTLWVSNDGCETWTQLLIANEHDNAYGWTESGDISLARFAGSEYVNIAFQYISNTSYYGTWEVTDVKVEDRAPAFTTIAELDNAAANSEATYTMTLTDAVVTYVNGNNAFIEDATGGIQLYKKSHGLTAGQKINGTVTVAVKLYNLYAEATSFDVSAATLSEATVQPTTLTLDKLLKDYLRYQNCYVKLEGVTFDTAITPSNRNGQISQSGQTLAAYAQVKDTLDMSGTGDLICFPTRYKTTLQVGVWDNAHWTAN